METVLASSLLSSVKSARPWLKFGMQNEDRAEAVVPTMSMPRVPTTPISPI